MIKRLKSQWPALVVAICFSGCSEETVTPTSPTPTPSFTFASAFTSSGSATRSFVTGGMGAITVTLTSVTPSVPLAIGVGIPRDDAGGCSVSKSVEASAGSEPQLTVTAEPGTYCVKVSDAGQVRETATFSVTVVYP